MYGPEEQEFQELQKECKDTDATIRGVAAVDLGSFATEYPAYKERCVMLLQGLLHDTDADVRDSAKSSLDVIEGKEVIVPGQRIIGFGYIPEEYREAQPEVNKRQMIISCVCCIMLIVMFFLLFSAFF